MKERYLVGVDIGTLGTKAVVVTPDGRVLGSAIAEYGVSHPQPSWAEQHPEVWEAAVYAALKESLDKAAVPRHAVAGVCISSLYGGAGIPVDKNVDPLHPCLIWMDRRATREVTWIKEHVDLDELFRVTGNYVDSYFGFPKILWIKRNLPDVWKRIDKFVPPSSFIVHRLTGTLAVDYSSAGNLGGLLDIHRLEWSEAMSEALGIPLEMMPETLVESAAIVGEVTTQAAGRCGLTAGTPVLAGGIDAPMATLSAGAIEPGANVAMMGTSTCWGVVHHGQRLSKQLVSMPHVINGQKKIYTWAGAATSGALVRWFRDQFGRPEIDRAARLDTSVYQLLDEAAAAVPVGSDGLITLPYFMGERAPLWDPAARGTLVGLTLYHTRAHIFRSFLESAAFSLRHSIETATSLGVELCPETMVVGGTTKSPLWLRILADVTGRDLIVPAGGVGAPIADALLVGLATGHVADVREIKRWTDHGERVRPELVAASQYDEYYRLYRSLYEAISGPMHELSALGGARP